MLWNISESQNPSIAIRINENGLDGTRLVKAQGCISRLPYIRVCGTPQAIVTARPIQIFDRPDLPNDAGRNRWRWAFARPFVLSHFPAEVEVGDVQGARGREVLQFLRE